MLWVLLPLVAGIISAQYLVLPLLLPLLVVVTCIALLLIKGWIAALYPLIYCVGFFATTLSYGSITPATTQYDATIALHINNRYEGEILARQDRDDSWYTTRHKVAISAGAADSLLHQTIICRANILQLNPDENSYLRTMHQKGYSGVVKISKVLNTSELAQIPLPRRVNNWALQRLERLELREVTFASAAAMSLARREFLDYDLRESYSRSGTAHLLALSGLHLGVVLMIITSACYFIPLLRRGHIVADILAIVAIWLFAVMAGLGESVMRAAWMFSLLQLAALFSRRYNSLNSLYTAAVMILCCDPAALYDISFRLSFVAVAGILLVGAPLSRRLQSGNFVVDFVVTSIVIGATSTIATSPLISHYFGYIVLLSPLTTAPLLLTLTVIILSSTLWVMAPLPLLAPIASYAIECAVTIQNHIVAWFASWGYGLIDYRLEGELLGVTYIAMLVIFKWLHTYLTRPRQRSIHDEFAKINREDR
ncbi:MAG: ComEC/Rec2 family competence protein [Rikenellaceae bacterium]